MATCKIQWQQVTMPDQTPSAAKAMCLTHNFDVTKMPLATVCPIGQIEDATEIALRLIDDRTQASLIKEGEVIMALVRKNKDWCSEHNAAHAWEGQDNMQISRDPENEDGTWVAVRVCENCGKKQTRKIMSSVPLRWEDAR